MQKISFLSSVSLNIWRPESDFQKIKIWNSLTVKKWSLLLDVFGIRMGYSILCLRFVNFLQIFGGFETWNNLLSPRDDTMLLQI